MSNVDSLDIQIKAQATSAEKALDRLVTKLDKLSSSMSRVNNSGLKKLSAGMQQISNSTGKTKNSTKNLSSSFGTLSSKLNQSANSLSRLNASFDKLVPKMNKVNKSAKSTSSSFGSMLKTAIPLTATIKGIGDAIESSMSYIETLNYFDKAFEQVAEKADLSAFREMGYKSAEEYANSFSERAKKLTAKMSGFTINEDGSLTESGGTSLGIDPDQVMQYQAMFGQMASSMGATSENALLLSDVLTKIGADLASVKNMKFEDVWTDMASGLAGMSRTLDKYGVNIRNVNLQQKLTELGIDANIQALNQQDKALLRTIILLDSTRYAWGDLSETLNQPANQLRLLSANWANLSRTIGNLFLPIVQKVLPYINGLVIALQRLFAWIGKLLGLDLSGITSSVGSGGNSIGDLIGDTEDLTGSLDDAEDSAKSLKRQLQGFDKLNVITTPSAGIDTSGLGSLGSGLLNDAFLDAISEYQAAWDKAFEELENRANEIADNIEKAFKDFFTPIATAWGEKGKYVMDSWKFALDEIWGLIKSIGSDFYEVWQQAETIEIFKDIFTIITNIGYTVGYLAQNFREAWDENETGKQILENIRDIIGVVVENIREMSYQTALWAENIDFEPLLTKIKEWTASLTPVIDNLSGIVSDFYTQVLLPLGKWVLEEGLPKLLDVFIGFNNNVDWESLRSRLSEFWDHLEPFAEKVGEGLILFIEDISILISEFSNSEAFGNFLTDIGEWMDKATPEGIEEGIIKIVTALAALKLGILAFSGISSIIKTVFDGIAGIAAISSLFGTGGATASGATALGGVGATATASLGPIIAITSAITALVVGLGYVFATNEQVRESFNNAISSIKEGLQPAIEFFTNTLLPNLRDGWSRILEILSPLGQFLEGTFVSIWQDMINPALTYIGQTVLPMLTQAFEILWNNVLVPLGTFLANVLEPVIKILSDGLKMLWEDVVVPLADAIGNILAKAFEGLIEQFNFLNEDTLKPLMDTLNSLWDNVLSPLVDYIWNTLKPVFEDAFDAIKRVIEGLGVALGGLIDFITGVFTGNWEKAWQGIKDFFKGIFNGIVSILEGAMNLLVDGINSFLGQFNILVESVGSKIGLNISIPQLPKVQLPRLEYGGLVTSHIIAEIGEYNKAEAILPLTNQSAMQTIADSILQNASYQGYSTPDDFVYQVEEATYRGTMRAIMESGGITADVSVELEGTSGDLFKVVRKEWTSEAKRLQRNPVPIIV